MVSFYVYDIAILIIFAALLIAFFTKNKKNLKQESIFLMYRSQAGIKIINYIGDNFKKTLHVIKYVIIVVGFILTFILLWMLGKTFYIYAVTPQITEIISAPPIAPLVPYFPEIFGLQSFFPNLYFIYFVIALAIVMIVHEFSHGIYMRLFKIKIKSTGLIFGWLIYTWVFMGFVKIFTKVTRNKTAGLIMGIATSVILIVALAIYSFTFNISALFILIILIFPLLGAFVEEDKDDFVKKKKLEQMSVLGAGVFANILTGMVFLILLLLVYNFGYHQGGYAFNSYSFEYIPADNITSFGDTFEGTIIVQGFERVTNLTEISVNGSKFFITSEIKESLQNKNPEKYVVLAFHDSPAIRNGLKGGIVQIDEMKIKGVDDLKTALLSSSPGQEVKITTDLNGQLKEFNVVLGTSPVDPSKSFFGIAYIPPQESSEFSLASIGEQISKGYYYITNPDIRGNGNFYVAESRAVTFIYDLLWWIVVINFLVAVFNMLPAGPFDGGRFFMLAVLSITGSEKIAKWASRIMGYIILFGFIFIMVIWAFNRFI